MAGSTADDKITDHGVQLTAKWDWTTSNSTGRWSAPQQAIRPRRYFIPSDSTDTRNDGFGIWKSKLKIRGKGEALVLRFESETGKDFQLLGWAIPFTVEV